jgi:hypothetical protein
VLLSALLVVLLSMVLFPWVLLLLAVLFSVVLLSMVLLPAVPLSMLLLPPMLIPTLIPVSLPALLSILLVVLLVVIEDGNALVAVGALDEPVVASAMGSSLVLCTAEEVGEADEVDSTGSSDITEVVLEVDKSDGKSGRPTVTAAVANAVVLPRASTSAVTATTTSAFEFVLNMLGSIAVP